MVEGNMNKIDELELGYMQVKDLTKDAKGLSYPIVDIQIKLLSLAEKYNLEQEMEDYLDIVRDKANELESAFFECQALFEDAIRDEIYKEEENEDE
jgi:hypothetical protein